MYYGQCASMMHEMALAINETADAEHFKNVFESIKKAFSQHYSDETGQLKINQAAYGDGTGYIVDDMGFGGHTQTAYANAIYSNILAPEKESKAGNFLAELIAENDGKLSTGFLGFKPLLPALSATGHSDVAYKLILSTEYPSLGFEIINGANTIWERWNSYIKDVGFESNADMNSFNHYAFGSVNEWMFGNMAGIKVNQAGYRSFIIRPEIAKEKISQVNATYHSINGQIVSSWKKQDGNLRLTVVVPCNTEADIFIPSLQNEEIYEGDKLISEQSEIRTIAFENGYLHVKVGSGTYEFNSKL
jgi:alpha-L-rhamnosidase